MRNTKQKDLIMKTVHGHGQHPTADEVYQSLKLSNPKLSLATVYRNLNQFADNGELGRVVIDGEPIHFDIHTGEHCHAVCEYCGKIMDIFDQGLQNRISEYFANIEGMTDFQLTRADLKFIGLCPECTAKKSL